MILARRLFALNVEIDVPSPGLSHELAWLLSRFPAPPLEIQPDVRIAVELGEGGYRILDADGMVDKVGRNEVYHTILDRLIRTYYQRPTVALLHASAVGREGKVLLFIGHTHAGKTTLSTALVRQGCLHFSDDLVPLSMTSLQVSPCPLPLRLRAGALSLLGSLEPDFMYSPVPLGAEGYEVMHVLPAEGSADPETDWPIGAVVFLIQRPDRPSECRPLGRGAAAFRLLRAIFNSAAVGQAGFSTVVDLVERVPCYELFSCGLPETVRCVEEICREQDVEKGR